MSHSQQVSRSPVFYDVRYVAEMFGISRMSVYRVIRSGQLPAVRMGGQWFVPARVIEALVAAAEEAARKQAAAAAERVVNGGSDWTPDWVAGR